jgi:uncharacterized protein (DUF433 family)
MTLSEQEPEAMRARIEVNPQVHFGKPCVSGTRIPVQDVLELVKEGIPFKEIVRDYYPDIQIADVRACVEAGRHRYRKLTPA